MLSYQASALVEMGSYPAPDNMQLDNLARQGRLLVYSLWKLQLTRLARSIMECTEISIPKENGFTYYSD